MNRNLIIILIIVIRYISIYFPLLFSENLDICVCNCDYDNYTIAQNIGECLTIGIFIFSLSFFTKIKELRYMIYVLAGAEIWDTIKLYCYMVGIDNIIIHETKLFELILGIVFLILTPIYLIIKYKRNEKNIINNNI